MIDNWTIGILMTILKYSTISLFELEVETKLDRESIQNNINLINKVLDKKDLNCIVEDSDQYSVPNILRENKDEVLDLFRSHQIILSQEERLILVYLFIFCRQEFISNHHLQDFLNVSKNTTLNDIKKLRMECLDNKVKFEYTRSKGYHLVGDEINKYRLAQKFISKMQSQSNGEWSTTYLFNQWEHKNESDALQQLILKFVKNHNLIILDDRLNECVILILMLSIRFKYHSIPVLNLETYNSDMMDNLVENICIFLSGKFGLENIAATSIGIYFQNILMGCFEGNILDTRNEFFQQLTIDIVQRMEKLSLVEFNNRERLIEGLFQHLVPAYYRLKNKMFTVNTYTSVVKDEYQSLFDIVKAALKPLQRLIDYPIPDSEICYFVIHFGGFIKDIQKQETKIKALLICPNGVSSSLVVQDELKKLFPNIIFLDIHRHEDINSMGFLEYDLVFSTVKVRTSKPTYTVPVLMNEHEKNELFYMVKKEFPRADRYSRDVEELMIIIEKHADINNEKDLKFLISQYLNTEKNYKKVVSPLLKELITKETYQVTDQNLNWKEAIALAAKPLQEKSIIDDNYIPAMVNKVEEFGPFIDLGKGVAIPHARPEDGVNEIGMSMLVLKEPVYLANDKDHPIEVMICIAAVDNKSHLKALSHLTRILRDNEMVEQIKQSNKFVDIEDILNEEE